MRTHRIPVLAALVGVAIGLGACSSSGGSSGASTSQTAATISPTTTSSAPSGATTTLVVGAVPTLELGLISVGEQQGFFADEGIQLEITNVDSGPNVVTGVVAGQYDLGYTAYAPPLLAVAEQAPLVLVSNTTTVGPSGTNGGVLVRKDSGIKDWAGLAGASLGTNAPRSLFSLTVPAAVSAAGADATAIELVPLPFNQIAKAVQDGQVKAGVTLEPYQTQALKEFPDLVDIGDSVADTLPEGSPSGLFFTSTDTDSAKADAIAAFQRALDKAIAYANQDLDAVKEAGAPLAGLDPAVAQKLPLNPFDGTVTAEDLQPLLDLMVAQKWITASPDLTSFLGTP